MFDACIIEVGTARQKRAFEGLLEERRKRGLYPRELDFRVIPDPEGGRVGSGGALLNVLSFIQQHYSGQQRIFIVQAGGESRSWPPGMRSWISTRMRSLGNARRFAGSPAFVPGRRLPSRGVQAPRGQGRGIGLLPEDAVRFSAPERGHRRQLLRARHGDRFAVEAGVGGFPQRGGHPRRRVGHGRGNGRKRSGIHRNCHRSGSVPP